MKLTSRTRMALTAAGFSVPMLFTTGALSSPEIQQQGTVSFMTGGVGSTEMDEMKALSSGYPVEVIFLANSNPDRYLSQIKVQIKDNNGKVVLDTESQGPMLLAKMPAGRYSVSADVGGDVRRQTMQVAEVKGSRVVFVWNRPVDQ